MNIVFSSDDNYAPFLGIAIFSLLKSNYCNEESEYKEPIVFYILDMNISEKNKTLIDEIVHQYNSQINYLETKEIHVYLENKVKLAVRSLATYYRLFLPTLLPESINKVIYMDCDSIINGSLKELWEEDVDGFDIAGVLDTISGDKKLSVGLNASDPYVNAGMLLINLKQWRAVNMEQQMMDFINKYDGKVVYHDQGTINGVCLKKKVIHPKFNAMTPIFVLNRSQIIDYHILDDYYSEKELSEAKNNPVFCHLTPYFTDRPWVKGNHHPLTKLYKKYQKQTPWKNVQFSQPSKTLEPWVKELFYFLPYALFIKTLRFLQGFRVRTFLSRLVRIEGKKSK
jgi:lipopolysaccharide biosynthesis glycosyltransferase